MRKISCVKVTSFILIFTLLFVSLSSAVFAQSNKDSDRKAISYLDKKYNLKKIEKIPEGIIPKSFNTVKEADEYLASIGVKPSSTNALESDSKAEISPMAIGSDSVSTWCTAVLWVRTNVTYEYLYSQALAKNYYNKVISLTSSGEVYGPFIAWLPQDSDNYYNISGDKLTLSTHVAGTCEMYFIVEGIGRVLAQYCTFNSTFTNP